MPARGTANQSDQHLEVWALALSALALVASAVSAAVAFRGDEREERQTRQSYAQQVVVVVTDDVTPSLGGARPQITGSTITVANFGDFPVEDVVVERPSDGPLELASDLGELPAQVPAVRMGTVGPCQTASVSSSSSERFERATFVDVNGVTWLREPASPPTEDLPDDGVQRAFPDLRSADRVQRSVLDGCD